MPTASGSSSSTSASTSTATDTTVSNMIYTRTGYLDVFTITASPNSIIQVLRQDGNDVNFATTLYLGPSPGQIVTIPPGFAGAMTPAYAGLSTGTSTSTKAATRPAAAARKGSKRQYEAISPTSDLLGIAMGMSTGGKLGSMG